MWEANPLQDLFGDKSQQLGKARPVTAELTEDDLEVDRTLRPKTLDQYVGQERVRDNLRVLIEAAKTREEPLDHVLFLALQDLAKLLLQMFLQMRWVQNCIPPAVLLLSAREI